MRRIRSVRLTVTFAGDARPANVSCTLALLASSVRMRVTTGAYARRSPTEPDPRFRDEIGAVQSIVTSSGRDDGGVFERGGDDPRYLPFEGAGAISRWKIDLPRAQPAGDRSARVEDVVLHLSYTARDGGSALKETVLREARAQARKETAN
jgi:hypothetical protein